ncbi:MAG TPA: ABC transporter ATP-binding protein [Candidatus Limnocylindria bacterium]|jgi:branched-chain amino acid transport system ATP-binding protein
MAGLEIRGLCAGYGRIGVLRGVDLSVADGSLVALIGANGAGKSTLLKCVSGLIRSSAGEISSGGRRIDRLGPAAIVRLGLSHVPERRQVFAELSVLDNLRLGAYRARLSSGELAGRVDEVLTLFPALVPRLAHDAAALSGGQQQMLAIARGLMSKPQVLMLDEPSLGLAPALVREIFSGLVTLRRGGLSILLVEQNARGSLAIADRAYVLEGGRVALEGTGQELLVSPDVVHRYLGVGSADGPGGIGSESSVLADHLRRMTAATGDGLDQSGRNTTG